MLAAATLALVVIAASAAAMTMGPATDTAAGSPASPSVTSPTTRSTDDRASRSGIRELPASPSASPPASSAVPPVPKPAPSTKKPTPPPGGGTVTGGGSCEASYYTGGGHTADGEVFNTYDFTAANRTLPFNTRVRVTNVANNKSTVVRVNDRGPFVANRCFDLTQAAFGAIANLGAGVITIRYEVLS